MNNPFGVSEYVAGAVKVVGSLAILFGFTVLGVLLVRGMWEGLVFIWTLGGLWP